MGHPTWQRLAELGQLPDYMKTEENQALIDANDNARSGVSGDVTVNGAKATPKEPVMPSVDTTETASIKEAVRLEDKTNAELQGILLNMGLSTTGVKAELIKRINDANTPFIQSASDSESLSGEFIDPLLQ